MVIFFNFSPTSNHLHPLQVENCDSNSRFVVDDYGKFRIERVKLICEQLSEFASYFASFQCSICHIQQLLSTEEATTMSTWQACNYYNQVTQSFVVIFSSLTNLQMYFYVLSCVFPSKHKVLTYLVLGINEINGDLSHICAHIG